MSLELSFIILLHWMLVIDFRGMLLLVYVTLFVYVPCNLGYRLSHVSIKFCLAIKKIIAMKNQNPNTRIWFHW